MYGIHYQLILYMLVVLICFKNRIDKYLLRTGYTQNHGWVQLRNCN